MRLASLILLVLAPNLAFASDVEFASRIDAVTAYPDGATVTRVGRISLPAGASSVVLRGMPASLDPASIRVEGQGSAPITLGSVDVRIVPGEAKPAVDPELEAKLTRLRDERDGVAARIAALDGKRMAVERFAQASPEKLGDGKPLEVSQWQAAWDAVGSGLAAVHEDLRQARGRMRDLDGEIAALERARPAPPRPGAPRRDVVIAVETGSSVEAELRVNYRVAGASWVPAYDARLDTGAKDRKPSLVLARRAVVSQRTGEDWTDVELAVSTVRVTRGTAAPDLPPLQILFYEPQLFRERAAGAAMAPAAPAPATASRALETARPDAAPKVEAVQQQATSEVGAFQAVFRVPGRVTVPQDGSTKALELTSRTIEPSLSVSATPELDETAYLKASFGQEEETPLLAGEVSLHRDGSFVGRSRLKLTPPGESVELGFGADDRVKVARVPVRRRENEPGWIAQNKTDLREFKTTVRNLHAQPIRITVTDRIPFSENTAITVEQLRETTPPTEKQPNDRRGLLAWTYDYASNEQREIRLAYRMRWPAERDVVFEPRR